MRRRVQSATMNGQDIEAPINLTPLIDVVFVILIMFILVAPLLELDQIQLAPSSINSTDISSTVEATHPLTIRVQSDNTIWINQQCVTTLQLMSLMQKMHEQLPDNKPLLIHDKRAQFGTYQEVKNCIEEAGYDEMDLLLAPS